MLLQEIVNASLGNEKLKGRCKHLHLTLPMIDILCHFNHHFRFDLL